MDVPSRGGGEREQEDFVGEARERRGTTAVASLLVVGGQVRHWTADQQAGEEGRAHPHCHAWETHFPLYCTLEQSLSRAHAESTVVLTRFF